MKPMTPRPVPESGSAAGKGVTDILLDSTPRAVIAWSKEPILM